MVNETGYQTIYWIPIKCRISGAAIVLPDTGATLNHLGLDATEDLEDLSLVLEDDIEDYFSSMLKPDTKSDQKKDPKSNTINTTASDSESVRIYNLKSDARSNPKQATKSDLGSDQKDTKESNSDSTPDPIDDSKEEDNAERDLIKESDLQDFNLDHWTIKDCDVRLKDIFKHKGTKLSRTGKEEEN